MTGDGPRDLSALLEEFEGDVFEFFGEGGRGEIAGFVQGRDRISLVPLGLTPDDLLISIEGRDLMLAFDGGEVLLLGCASLTLTEADFRF
jgi:hypothetical protein